MKDISHPLDDQLFSLVAKEKINKRESDRLQRCKSIKPIISPDIDQQIHAAVAQYTNSHLWIEWGMKYFRTQGACILLKGPPGCGKTVIAKYLASLVNKPFKEIDLSKFGSTTPGENERNIATLFQEAGKSSATIFMDEVDAILWDRKNAGANSMWMLAVIDKLLVEISNYRYLLVMATNRDELLDTALERRLIANIYIGKPEAPERIKLWQSKLPAKYPLKLSTVQFQHLSEYKLTGAEIETAIIMETQLAIVQKRKPNFDSLCNVAKSNQK